MEALMRTSYWLGWEWGQLARGWILARREARLDLSQVQLSFLCAACARKPAGLYSRATQGN